ncbi:MAG: hypothetical protein IJW87_05870 [Clostridia bacterium]|nr:hypothetical protein [Clostridia bacterium]
MKKRIIVNKGNDKIDFFLVSDKGRHYLFTQAFSKGVYDFFRDGKAESELRSYKTWEKNPRLDKTIEKIPMYVRYVEREVI